MLKKSLLFIVILIISLLVARPIIDVYAAEPEFEQRAIESVVEEVDSNPVFLFHAFPKVEYDEKDLTKTSNVTEDVLNNVLIKNLSDQAHLFLEAEEESGINAFFLVALAAVESGWGDKPNYKNNLFGWTGGEKYNNPLDSIIELSNKIKELYLSPSGRYFEGYSLQNVNTHYNGREEWYSRVNSMAIDLHSKCVDKSEEQWYNMIIKENKENNVIYGELFECAHPHSLFKYTNA